MESAKYQIKIRLKVCAVIIYKFRINTYTLSKKGFSYVAVNSSNSRKNSPELSFHLFLKLNDGNSEIPTRWLATVKRYNSSMLKENRFFLFSSHFEKPCFERDLKISFHIIPNNLRVLIFADTNFRDFCKTEKQRIALPNI